MFRNRVHWICCAIAMAALGCGTAKAQLTNCKDPGSPEVFKIFVDEVRVTGGSGGNAKVEAKLLSIHSFLSENLRVSSGDNGSVRDCGKRAIGNLFGPFLLLRWWGLCISAWNDNQEDYGESGTTAARTFHRTPNAARHAYPPRHYARSRD